MDLHTAVAASMLPASRAAIAAAFKALRYDHGTGPPFLEFLWAATGHRDPLAPAAIAEIVAAAAGAITGAPKLGIRPIAAFDPDYPALLSCTPDPPPVLWARAQSAVHPPPPVAVVGPRPATQ
jgi:hypothetical protein